MNISLRKWTLDDQDELVTICNHMDRTYLSNQIPDPYTKKDAEWWINMSLEKEGTDGIFRAIICDNVYVGNISVERKSDVYSKDAEIGFYLLNDKSAKGIMTEAVKQICSIVWKELDVIRITGLVYHLNIASKKVLKKNEFTLEGVMKQAVYKSDHIYDLCVYGLYMAF